MRTLLAVLITVIGINFSTAQKEINGVKVANTETFQEKELSLNGAGLREKLWFDLYVGMLYVTNKSKSADALINSDNPMAIKLHITDSKVTQEKMVKAVNEGFENSSHGKATKAQIAKFISFFSEKIAEGTIFDIVYMDGKTTVYRNGTKKGSVEGLEFKKALYAIWLGNDPADEDLKEGMLGK
ncbi:chalcone isomerase family protein [Pseudofulvibacter geojedonensis]|uniref:Chalcone isomerase family protein n=1 Tax=Pseudofulvibacter geojedonensis TaxID=1123758 RepID=A0ABW3HZF2_9FLAO